MSTWLYVRDVVRIGPVLKQHLDAEIARGSIPEGSTIKICGRMVEHEPGYVLDLPSRHITITAGIYDCNGGWIETSAVGKGSDGSPGANGADAQVDASLNVTAATPGAAGRRGVPGGNATNVVLICHELRAAQFKARGGSGGNGGSGGAGGNGVWRCLRDHGPDSAEPICEIPPAAPGGDGGQGGPGGSGGQVRVICVVGTQALFELAGGPGGLGGAGGQGGLNNAPHPPWTREPSGAGGYDGQPGPHGTAQHEVVTDVDLWFRIQEHLSSDALLWAEYRLKMSEYYFRIYNRHSDALNLALTEASAVINLATGSVAAARAEGYRRAILNNQNIVYIERDLTLIPDFKRYHAVVVDYADSVRGLFYQGTTFLLEGMMAGNILQMLDLRKAHLEDALKDNGKLDKELEAAKKREEGAKLDASVLEQRLNQVQGRITALENDLTQNPASTGISLETGVALVFGTVVNVAVLVGTGGTAAGAIMQAFPFAVQLIVPKATADTFEQGLKIGKPMSDLILDYKKDGKGLAEYIRDGSNREQIGKTIIDMGKIVYELAKAKPGDDPRNTELLNQYREVTSLAHQHALAKLAFQQSGLAREAAIAAKQLAQNDLNRVVTARDAFANGAMILREAAWHALDSAREVQDLLLVYIFRTARALDLYTLSKTKWVENIRYDYGHVHPDLAANWRDGLLTDAELVRALNEVTPLPDTAAFLSEYDDYRQNLESDAPYTFVFTQQSHPSVIRQFKETSRLFLPVTLDGLRSNRYEIKVTGVRLRLTGITVPNNATFSCEIIHSGTSHQRRFLIGDVVTETLRPSIDSIELRLVTPSVYEGSFIASDGFDGEIRLRCFGRGVAADWTIIIDEMTGPIDLTNLSEARIEIENDAKIVR